MDRAPVTAAPPDGWQGILDPDEVILWQGRPRAGLSLRPFRPMRHAMGVVTAGFALFWMSMAAWITGGMDDGPVDLFPLFGLIFLAIGIWNAGLFVFWEAFLRANTTYSLSSRRGFVATDLPIKGRSLKSYPIKPDTPLEYDGQEPGTIWFAERYQSTKNGSRRVPIGFERIPDARAVYALLRSVQRGAA